MAIHKVTTKFDNLHQLGEYVSYGGETWVISGLHCIHGYDSTNWEYDLLKNHYGETGPHAHSPFVGHNETTSKSKVKEFEITKYEDAKVKELRELKEKEAKLLAELEKVRNQMK